MTERDVTAAPPRANPYVGLRPFFERDSLYFFGRGQQTAEVLEILHQHRFLGIVGSSGSGKSSLLRAGVIPKLQGGFLAHDRDRWQIVRMKPGDAPLANLAAALLDALPRAPGPSSSAPGGADDRTTLAASIRDDHTGAVIDLLRARLEPNANVFLLVDQFEEIFAFRGAQDDEGPATDAAPRRRARARKAEAAAFVHLILDLASRSDLPIYAALTMRTDFLGECDLFYGLPEALNRGRYLVPRLTRQQLREAIGGPAVLLGASIEPRLMDHLLNELGDRVDRLPVLQHALLRTWEAWQRSGAVGSIDFPHYDAAGRLDRALDLDAEAAFTGVDAPVATALFKRLTDTDLQARRVRSPARVSELMAVAAADRGVIDAMVRRFAEGGRSFLYTADDGTPDDPRVDIAHESLIRQWTRLRTWVDEERRSRDRYTELAARARKRERGEAALLQDPELRVTADWRDREHPSRAWAERYSADAGDFDAAIGYLDASIAAQSQHLAELEVASRWRIWNAVLLAAVLAIAVLAEMWYGDRQHGTDRTAARAAVERVEDRPAPALATNASAATSIATARIGDLEWTIDDRGTALDWEAANAHCLELTVASRSEWRLPTQGELLQIYDPADASAAGLKIKKPFHDRVTARYAWSGEWAVTPNDPLAADFSTGMFVPVPAAHAGGIRALCVRSPAAGRAQDLESRRAGVVEALRTYRPLGIVVLAYLVIAWAGKRLHRRIAFDRILRLFVAAGGRNPNEAPAAHGTAADAPVIHHTTYASTVRRIVGYAIDTAIHVAAALVLFFLLLVVVPVPVTVTLPSGEVVTGTLVSVDDATVVLTTADGTERSYPITHGPGIDIIDGAAVPGTLPSGASVQGRSFDRPRVVLTLPSAELIEGTLDQMTADRLTITTDDGTHRAFPLDPSAPKVEIDWPPSNAGIVWLIAVFVCLGWLYEAIQVSSPRQATLGMRVAGIFRTDVHGGRLSFARASAWYGYRLLSYLAYGLGFVSQPFTKRRQTFHDWMASTVVLRRAKSAADRT